MENSQQPNSNTTPTNNNSNDKNQKMVSEETANKSLSGSVSPNLPSESVLEKRTSSRRSRFGPRVDEPKKDEPQPSKEEEKSETQPVKPQEEEEFDDEDYDENDIKRRRRRKKVKTENQDEQGDVEIKKKSKKSALDNKNIPENLRQRYADFEKSDLVVAVGNTPLKVTLNELKSFFTTLVNSLKQQTYNPIRHIELGPDNLNFAVIEFDNRDLVQFVIKLENLEYQGYRMQVKKPRGFFDFVFDSHAQGKDPFGNFTTNASAIPQEDNKIYCGNLPLYLGEAEIRKLASTMGLLKMFNLIKDTEGNHKGYCFFEYIDPKVTEKAIKQLNGFEIGDKKLKVQKATGGKASSSATTAKGEPKIKATNASGSFLAGYKDFEDSNVQFMLSVPMKSKISSKVIQLLNMFKADDLMDDDYYNDLIKDIVDVCSEFGDIEKVVVPRPDLQTGKSGPSVGKVFVKFKELVIAKRARYRLAGKTYDRRTVVSAFYPEDKFESEEYLKTVLI